MKPALARAACLLCAAFASLAAPAASAGSQTIVRAAEQQSAPVNPANFTGAARSDGAFRQQAPARVYGGWVTFEPGSRTHWHIHPLGQTLIVTFGAGLTQVEGGPVREIRAGDIVICPPGGKHWHGAKPNQCSTLPSVNVLKTNRFNGLKKFRMKSTCSRSKHLQSNKRRPS